ncbi:hypothetical protein ACQR1W_31335 [Bradyrhizobium sp. HKCCYLS1011]|uniref:hypothetical protein n=1 Tax=Bradyrhizobium sp. HKCCYLS1011 TaxID=3420733 RepID=UPI003EC0B7C3
MLKAMVADSKKHAEVMIAWHNLDPKEWEALAYGQPVTKLYSVAFIIRPLRGIEQHHTDWVLEQLVPSVAQDVHTLPASWRIPQEHVT